MLRTTSDVGAFFDLLRILSGKQVFRPLYLPVPDSALVFRAHFLICYTALLVYRLLEVMLDDQKTHVTPGNLITTLTGF